MAVIPVSPSKFNKYLQILYVLRIKKKLEVKSPILILTISRRQEVWKNALCQNLTRVVSVCCQCQPTKTHFILISGACWNHQNRRSIFKWKPDMTEKYVCYLERKCWQNPGVNRFNLKNMTCSVKYIYFFQI